jgi:CRP-like cAMP-binding protein
VEKGYFLDRLTPQERLILKNALESVVFKKDASILREGDKSDDIFFLEEGKVSIYKQGTTGNLFAIASLEKDSIFGEMSFLDGSPRSATIKASEDSQCLVLSKKRLKEVEGGEAIIDKIKLSLAVSQNERIRIGNQQFVQKLEDEIKRLNDNIHFGRFFVALLTSVMTIILVNHIITKYFTQLDVMHPFFAWAYLLLLVAPMFIIIWKMDYSLNQFGLSLKNWKEDILWGLKFSMPFFLIMITLSSLYYYFRGGSTIFDHAVPHHIHPQMVFYVAHSYLQEIGFRGIVQNSLKMFFSDTKGHFSVFISALLFGMVHIHLSLMAVVITFFSGILFGYIFLKRPSVLSVTVVHALLGWVALVIGLVG